MAEEMWGPEWIFKPIHKPDRQRIAYDHRAHTDWEGYFSTSVYYMPTCEYAYIYTYHPQMKQIPKARKSIRKMALYSAAQLSHLWTFTQKKWSRHTEKKHAHPRTTSWFTEAKAQNPLMCPFTAELGGGCRGNDSMQLKLHFVQP